MSWFTKALKSSVGKKFVLGLTGLALVGFLMEHLVGNLLMYKSADSFNGYAHMLESSELILPAELGLLALFLVHILLAITVTVENKSARPEVYSMYASKGGRTLASKTMIYTGVLIFVFLVLHLLHFRFGVQSLDAEGRRNLYAAILALFRSPVYVAWYVLAVCLVGLHVSHGFQSALRSIGLNHPKYTPALESLSCLFGFLFAIGFSSFALWAHFFKGGS